MKSKQLLIFILLSVVLHLAIAPLGGAWEWTGHHIKFLAAAILYMVLTMYMLRKSDTLGSGVAILLITAVPILLTNMIGIIIHLVNGSGFVQSIISSSISWPSTLAQFAGIALGFWINRVKLKYKLIIGLLWTGFSIWVMLSGYDLWLHRVDYGTFMGTVDEVAASYILTDSENNSYSNQDFIKNLLVLEFWNTGCGFCFKEMPEFQKLFDQYSKNGKVKFYSVNAPSRYDTLGYAEFLLNKYQFSFPLLFASEDIVNKFGIEVYPTYLILERNSIIYRGSIKGIEKIVKARLE